jgi:hypothetical protein
LPEEPHVLALDDALGALYIGHLTVTANSQIQGGGVSTWIFATHKVNRRLFRGPGGA